MRYCRGFFVIAVLLNLVVNSVAWGVVQSSLPQPRQQKLRWADGPIRIAVSRSLLESEPNVKVNSDVTGAVQRSLKAWEDVADIEFVEESSENLSVSPAGVAGDGVSLITIAATPENVLLFGKSDESTAAKTRVFYNRRGSITEADIVLSPFQQFSTDGTYGTFDLETTLKHEIGHLLGLHHSTVTGSLMYGVSARTGVFGDNFLGAETLRPDDISAIRDLYGSRRDDQCCGGVNGRFVSSIRSALRTFDVWLRDSETGAVVAHTLAAKDGTFALGGLDKGVYDITARDTSRSPDYALFELGSVAVEAGSTTVVTRKLVHKTKDFTLSLVGKNGILSDSPLKLQKGTSYTLYLGGKNLSAGRLRLGSDSPFFDFDSGSVAEQAYEGGVTGLSFVLFVSGETPSGSYNLCAASTSGARDCIVGGISVVD